MPTRKDTTAKTSFDLATGDRDLDTFVNTMTMKYKIDCLRAIRASTSPDRQGPIVDGPFRPHSEHQAPHEVQRASLNVGEVATEYVKSLAWNPSTLRAACNRATGTMLGFLHHKNISFQTLSTSSMTVERGEWSFLVNKSVALPEWFALIARLLAGLDSTDSGVGPSNQRLRLNITRVKCVDETGSGPLDELGRDEINMSAIMLDPSGASNVVDEFVVGTFNDGTERPVNRALYTFPLDDDYDPPKGFTAILTIAEKDSGGFAKFIRKLYEAIKKDIDALMMEIGTAAGTAIGAYIGGGALSFSGPIGAVLGAIAGAIVGAIVSWLINVFEDDIFAPQSLLVALSSPRARFSSSMTSPEQVLRFKGHHGEYKVYCVWQLE